MRIILSCDICRVQCELIIFSKGATTDPITPLLAPVAPQSNVARKLDTSHVNNIALKHTI